MRSLRGLAPVLALAAAALACRGLPGGTVLFKDDFSDASGGWKYTGYSSYADGELRLRVSDSDTLVDTLVDHLSLSDIHLDVTARNSASAGDEVFGLVCDFRANGDQADGYFLGIDTDGYYLIGKLAGGQITTLEDGLGDGYTDAAATYRLGADCGNGRLSLLVNGQTVASASDTSYTSGDVGLFLVSGKKLPAEAAFGNFVVSTLGSTTLR
jgi:hypothetical protein